MSKGRIGEAREQKTFASLPVGARFRWADQSDGTVPSGEWVKADAERAYPAEWFHVPSAEPGEVVEETK